MRARVRDTELFFDVDGSALVPDGPRMREQRQAMVVHGGPGSDHTSLKAGLTSLADRMQIIYFDHRGQGRSARGDVATYSLDNNVEDMEALRQHLGLGPIISIGTSYGGMVAMAHAARYPRAVSHLVVAVTAAHAGFIPRALQIVSDRGSSEQIAQCQELFGGRIDTPEKYRHFFDVMGPLYSRRHDPVEAKLRFERTLLTTEALNQAYGPHGTMRGFDLRPELGSVIAPTLILAARHDWICAPEFSEEILSLIPDSELRVFEESGHSILADEPRLFLDAVAGFLVYRSG